MINAIKARTFVKQSVLACNCEVSGQRWILYKSIVISVSSKNAKQHQTLGKE